MDVPDLVRQAVGDEDVRAGVTLGDEDAVVLTPTRALVYRGEGLLSDEDVDAYGFDFERLAVSEGRRKTKFTMSYVEGERSFTVPGKRTDDVLAQLIEGTLRVAGAIDGDESVTGVFRFSEMTLVVAEGRMLKHIGEYTWDADFEAFPYDELTKLAFEEGSVATQVVLSVGNRSERIKAPNAEAGLVRKTLQEAVFAHYGVGSLEELNREIAVEADEEGGPSDVTGGLGLDSGIDPLVSEGENADASEGDRTAEAFSTADEDRSGSRSGEASTQSSSPERSTSRQPSSGSTGSASESPARSQRTSTGSDSSGSAADRSASAGNGPDRDDAATATSPESDSVSVPSVESSNQEVLEQLSDLTQAVERQNELLHRQQQTVQQLIEELRQGR